MASRIAAVGRVTVSERRSMRPPADMRRNVSEALRGGLRLRARGRAGVSRQGRRRRGRRVAQLFLQLAFQLEQELVFHVAGAAADLERQAGGLAAVAVLGVRELQRALEGLAVVGELEE